MPFIDNTQPNNTIRTGKWQEPPPFGAGALFCVLCPVGAGGAAVKAAELLGKVAGVVEAAAGGHLGDAVGRAGQKGVCGLHHAVFQQVLHGRHVDGLAKAAQAFPLADAGGPGDLGQGEGTVEVVLDEGQHQLHPRLVALHSDTTKSAAELLRGTAELLDTLPDINKAVLWNVVAFARAVAERSDENKMTCENIALCLGPTLTWSNEAKDPAAMMREMGPVNMLLISMINHPEIVPDTKYKIEPPKRRVKPASPPPLPPPLPPKPKADEHEVPPPPVEAPPPAAEEKPAEKPAAEAPAAEAAAKPAEEAKPADEAKPAAEAEAGKAAEEAKPAEEAEAGKVEEQEKETTSKEASEAQKP